MTDDAVGIILIFAQKLFGTREGYLIDIFLDVVGIHADAAVADGQRAGLFVDVHPDIQFAKVAVEISMCLECLQFLGRIDCI